VVSKISSAADIGNPQPVLWLLTAQFYQKGRKGIANISCYCKLAKKNFKFNASYFSSSAVFPDNEFT